MNAVEAFAKIIVVAFAYLMVAFIMIIFYLTVLVVIIVSLIVTLFAPRAIEKKPAVKISPE